MSPAKMDRCVKAIKKKLAKDEIKKTYKKNGKRRKTSPYAICKSALKKETTVPRIRRVNRMRRIRNWK